MYPVTVKYFVSLNTLKLYGNISLYLYIDYYITCEGVFLIDLVPQFFTVSDFGVFGDGFTKSCSYHNLKKFIFK